MVSGMISTRDMHTCWSRTLGSISCPSAARAALERASRYRLSPPEESWTELLRVALAPRDKYWRRDLASVLTDFIEDTAQSMALDGRALFEIVRGPKHERLQRQRWFKFIHFPDRWLRRRRNLYIQEGPLWDHTEGDPYHRVELPADSVLEIRLPSGIGESATQRRFLQTLNDLDTLSVMWPYQDMAEGKASPPFSFSDYRKNTYAKIARLTRLWGWYARNLWREDTLEYYQMYRILLFRRTLALLRGHILKELNGRLSELGMPGKLIIQGLPTMRDIDHILDELREGSMNFEEALKRSDVQ